MKFNKSFVIVYYSTNLHFTMKFQQIIEKYNQTSKIKKYIMDPPFISQKLHYGFTNL